MRMVVVLVEAQVPFSFKKRGYFYFIRHVPSDLSHHYASKKISYSLKTKSPRLATKRSLIAASQLDDYWDKLRGDSEQIPQQHFAAIDPVRTKEVVSSTSDLGPLLSEATFNSVNKLVAYDSGDGTVATYHYDALGRRIAIPARRASEAAALIEPSPRPAF